MKIEYFRSVNKLLLVDWYYVLDCQLVIEDSFVTIQELLP